MESPGIGQIHQQEINELHNVQEKELEAFLELNHLLSALATATIGGIGAIVLNRLKKELGTCQVIRAGSTFFFSGLSLYFGYFSYHRVVWMLHNHFFDLSIPALVFPERLQFAALLLALFVFGDFALSSFLGSET